MTEATLGEVEAVTAVYAPLAMSCSAIYSALERLAQVSLPDRWVITLCSTRNSSVGCVQVHFLYQFSLQFFMDIFHHVLRSSPELEATEADARVTYLHTRLFAVAYGTDKCQPLRVR